MSKVIWDGGALLAPVPAVLVTCGSAQKPNVLTIAWTGIINSHPPKTYISVRPERFSYDIIDKSGEFAINLVTEKLVRAADYCGVRSGAKENKFEAAHLTAESASKINCPIITESPLSLECRVTEKIRLGTHDMFIADILAADVDESLIDENGKLHIDKAHLVAYTHGEYFALGESLGTFGFTVRKKPPKK